MFHPWHSLEWLESQSPSVAVNEHDENQMDVASESTVAVISLQQYEPACRPPTIYGIHTR